MNLKIKNIKNIVTNKKIALLLFYGLWLIGTFFKVILFQFGSKINMLYMTSMNPKMIIASIASIIILFSLICIIFLKYHKGTLLVFYCLLSILLLGDLIYSRYYYIPLNISLINLTGSLTDVGESIKSFISIKDSLLIIDIPIIIILYLYIKKEKILFKKYILLVPCLVLIIGLIAFKQVYNNTDIKLHKFQKKNVVRDLGVLYFHYSDTKKYIITSINKNKNLSKEEIALINEQLYKPKTNELTGIAKGKNVLIIQMEAMQDFVINRSVEGKEITPNLNKLIKESFYFDNVYHQTASGNTSDSEFIFNNSLQPVKSGPVYYEYPNNYYYGVPKLLKNAGYNIYACHAFEPSMWNRTNVYKSFGYDRFFSKNDYKTDDKIGWGIADRPFLRQSIDHLLENTKDKPFFGFLVTLSLHHPYDGFTDYSFKVGEKYEDKQLGHFIKGANYADETLGEMIDYLKEKDIYKDTIIIMYGDHAAMRDDQKGVLPEFLGIEYDDFTWQSLQQIPLIIHIPGMKGSTSSKVAGQMDIAPTLMNLLDIKPPFMLGNDLMNKESRIVVNRYGTVVTDDFMYIPDFDKVYDFKTKKVTNKDNYMDIIKKAYKQLDASDLLVERDAIKKMKQTKEK